MPTCLTTRIIALALALGLGAASCTTNPTTGRKQFAMSREREVAMGEEAAPQLTQEYGGEVKDPALQAYVTGVGQKLKDQTEVDGPARTWKFTLLDSDVINAFALPGEKVFITRGLASKLDNEAQMAGVLGHETGHVMAKHVSERLSEQVLFGVGGTLAGAALGAATKNRTVQEVAPVAFGIGGTLVTLKFSRDQESEADSLGMRYMTRAGYNPQAQLQVMQVLDRESKGGQGLEMLATHPLPQTRIERVQHLLQTDYAATQGDSKYQFYPERYHQQFLSKLPPAKKADAGPEAGQGRLLARISLDDPTAWCAVCAAAAHAHEAQHGD